MERTINEALFAFPGYESLFVVILAGVTMYDLVIISVILTLKHNYVQNVLNLKKKREI